MENSECVKINLEIPFENSRVAKLVYDVLRVDTEPKRSGVTKELKAENNILLATFQAPLPRQLRVAINNFFDKIDLIAETIEVFGQPSCDYSFY